MLSAQLNLRLFLSLHMTLPVLSFSSVGMCTISRRGMFCQCSKHIFIGGQVSRKGHSRGKTFAKLPKAGLGIRNP